MFQLGDTVVHPRDGLCVVEDIRTEEFQKGEPRQYYLLRPLAEGGVTVYLPVDQQRVRLRAVMTPEVARSLKAAAEALPPLWCDNDRDRQSRFSAVLREGEPTAMLRLVLDVREQQKKRREAGQKLRYTDEQALQETLRLLRSEIAFALGIEVGEVTV